MVFLESLETPKVVFKDHANIPERTAATDQLDGKVVDVNNDSCVQPVDRDRLQPVIIIEQPLIAEQLRFGGMCCHAVKKFSVAAFLSLDAIPFLSRFFRVKLCRLARDEVSETRGSS